MPRGFKNLCVLCGSLFLLASITFALEVETDKSVIYPTTVGSTTVWSSYVTVHVTESGKPVQNANVTLVTESGALISTATSDESGAAVLSVLLRNPSALSILVDGKDSGKKIELASEGQKIEEEHKTPGAAGVFELNTSIALIFILMVVIITLGAWWKRKLK